MKINDTSRLMQLKMKSYQSPGRAYDKGEKQSADTVRDGISISQAALDKARDLHADNDNNAERIEAVKRSLQEGTYHVPTDAVVRKILEAYGKDLD